MKKLNQEKKEHLIKLYELSDYRDTVICAPNQEKLDNIIKELENEHFEHSQKNLEENQNDKFSPEEIFKHEDQLELMSVMLQTTSSDQIIGMCKNWKSDINFDFLEDENIKNALDFAKKIYHQKFPKEKKAFAWDEIRTTIKVLMEIHNSFFFKTLNEGEEKRYKDFVKL